MTRNRISMYRCVLAQVALAHHEDVIYWWIRKTFSGGFLWGVVTLSNGIPYRTMTSPVQMLDETVKITFKKMPRPASGWCVVCRCFLPQLAAMFLPIMNTHISLETLHRWIDFK